MLGFGPGFTKSRGGACTLKCAVQRGRAACKNALMPTAGNTIAVGAHRSSAQSK